MALDLDDIANRYNIADDGSREGDPAPVKGPLDQVLKAENDAYNAWSLNNPKLASNTDPEARQDAIDQATLFDSEGNYIGGILPDAGEVGSYSPSSSAPPSYYVYDKKSSDPTYAVPGTKNLFGGNLDVISKLDDISFEPFADGSLRNSIAYIVPWTRGGSVSRTQLSSAPGAAPRSAALETLIGEITDVGFNSEGTFDYFPDLESAYSDPQYIPIWDSEDSAWNLNTKDLVFTDNFLDSSVFSDFKGDLSSEYYSQYTELANGEYEKNKSSAETRQANLSSEIPIGFRQGLLTGARFLADEYIDNSILSNVTTEALNLAADIFDAPSGPIYLGNANGIINQVLDYANLFGVNIPTEFTTSIHPDLQSNKSKWNAANLSGASATPDGMWQFMFNPQEITLSVGPNFSAAEVWGVSDEANAGQPLHWTGHRNPELKFSRVLLNGYIFKKSVEDLEQGIIELFMKTPTNDATHGPKVLEFVWGKKCFGPCVIKDIQVNEKMWDNGLLVNAEVSFTLVRVPEWTVNDGQVSTYDPSALPPISSPSAPSGTTPSDGEGTDTPDEREKPQPPETQKENFGTFQQCKNIQSDTDAAQQVSNKIKSNSYDQGSGFYGGAGALSFSPGGYNPTFPSNLNTYSSALSKYKSNSFYSPHMAGFLGEKCLNPNFYFKTDGYDRDYRVLGGENKATKDQKIEIDKKYNAQLSSCADQLASIRGPLEQAYRNLKCNNYHTNPGNPTERL